MNETDFLLNEMMTIFIEGMSLQIEKSSVLAVGYA